MTSVLKAELIEVVSLPVHTPTGPQEADRLFRMDGQHECDDLGGVIQRLLILPMTSETVDAFLH